MNRKSVIPAMILLACALAPLSGVAAAPPTTGFVTVPGGKLFFEDRGRGPAVVLIHGGMLDHRMWDPQVEALVRHYRVIRYDVASHGQSPAIEGDWKAVDHLAALLDDRKVDRATLIGLSLGGRIAIDFAIAHPERVRSLVLVGPGMSGFPFTGRDWGARSADMYRARLAGNAARRAELFLRSWLAGPQRTPSQVDPQVWAKALEMAVPNAFRQQEGSTLEPPAVGRLGEITAPVLLIEGELDCEDIHRIVGLVERSVPGARRVVIPGVAHMPTLEKPAEVNRLILEFLRRDPAPVAKRPFGAQQQMLDVEGGQLWVERAGAGEPVVLIHDGIVHAVGWDDVLPALASQFEVIRYDRRGYGRSSIPKSKFSKLVDLEAVVALAKGRKVHLVGSSAGGGLAIDFALAHPESVASLTLVGAVVSGFPYTRHMAGRGGHLTAQARSDAAAGRRYWSTEDPYFVAPESKAVKERVAAILEASPQNLAGNGAFEIAAPPALPRLGSIRAPALVLVGEHDIPDVHAHAGAIAAGLPHAVREVISGSGHVPYLERPAEFVAYVVPFLQSASFTAVLDDAGVEAAARLLREARAQDRAAVLFSEDEMNRRGYRRLREGAVAEAIAIFRLNAEAFPGSSNAHDSLGEALLEAGDREGAVAAYRTALQIDPLNEHARAELQKIDHVPAQTSNTIAPPAPAADGRTIIEKTIRDAIGWALTKDRTRLESIMAHDQDFFIFHPDSKTTVRGYESFAKMIPDFMDPRFVATHFEVRELTPVFSRSGDVAWFSAMLEDCGTWMGKESCWRDTRWTGVLERRDGRWLIVQMHFSFAKDKVLTECPKSETKPAGSSQ